MGQSGTNDQDQSNNGKSTKTNNSNSSSGKRADSANSVTKSAAKKHEKGKDHTTNTSTSHKCRCASTSKSSRTTVSMASGGGSSSTIGATTAMSSAAVLRHLKDLPVRNYEKLPPTPPISMVKPTTATTTEQQAHSPKVAIKQNGHSSTIDECANNSDDALILRIGSLNNKTRHLSSLSINRDTALSREKFKGKIKVRTKTDPHPISSLHRLHDLSGSSTMPTRGSSAHAGSKCNCSSCKSQSSSVSISDNHNKTKSVGTQHDANKAYDPWVRQNASLSKSDGKPLAKTTTGTCSSTSNISSKSNLTQKIQANSNAKVIVITDDFKKKALNQEVFVDTKRKMLRYMKANNGGGGSGRIGENEDVSASKLQDNQKTGKSKSVDNLSQLSIELDQLDNVGSVELIFISDEYLNKVAKPDVIILVSPNVLLFVLFSFQPFYL